jgi:hypothetical protein
VSNPEIHLVGAELFLAPMHPRDAGSTKEVSPGVGKRRPTPTSHSPGTEWRTIDAAKKYRKDRKSCKMIYKKYLKSKM